MNQTLNPTANQTLTLKAERSVLVLVDYQTRLLPAIDGAARVLSAALRLADAARLLGVRVVGTEHHPERLGQSPAELRARLDLVVPKTHFDACGDGLATALRQDRADGQRPEVVVAGCEAHVCLLQTALGLLASGHRVWVVSSACGSRHAADHAAAMQRLAAAGATLVSDEMVLFEWLEHGNHPAFKPVLEIIKRRI